MTSLRLIGCANSSNRLSCIACRAPRTLTARSRSCGLRMATKTIRSDGCWSSKEGRFASSYRVKDGQIMVVNRHLGAQDMTITVLDNERNPRRRVPAQKLHGGSTGTPTRDAWRIAKAFRIAGSAWPVSICRARMPFRRPQRAAWRSAALRSAEPQVEDARVIGGAPRAAALLFFSLFPLVFTEIPCLYVRTPRRPKA